ncbi:MAG TPA: AAA family ATPase [Stellaceae bacterium]|nr:AAA family ATPase [Stellaceae bacterium]
MDDQREILAFLAAGASYGLPGATVERIDTHASSVFLVGERAYKLKRAVHYSYLDYSTVERRERACRAELALNRRTAPALYLAVRAIRRRAGGSLGFDGDGATLDWVVEMRRFDAANLFDRMGEENRLSPLLMRDLADAISAFHAAAEPSQSDGGSTAIAAVIADNLENLRAAGAALDQEAVTALAEAWRAELAAVAALLDRRRAAGQVRRCHGDLHLRNICLFEGKPTLFDAIEFSAAIAIIDVLYDLAFLLMDLMHRGMARLANLVFNRYLDRSGEDMAALAAMPLFLSLRSAIRAHVLVTAAASQPGEQAAALVALAQTYLRLARDLLRRQKPRLVAVGGMSGTGKSTLAQGLAADFLPAPGARVLRSDVLRKLLEGVPPETRLPQAAYRPAVTRQVYGRIYADAAAALAAGYSVIADAAFLAAKERAAVAASASAAAASFTGVWLEASPSVLAARLDARIGDASDANRAVMEQQRRLDPGAVLWPRIAASADADAVLAAARALVSSRKAE